MFMWLLTCKHKLICERGMDVKQAAGIDLNLLIMSIDFFCFTMRTSISTRAGDVNPPYLQLCSTVLLHNYYFKCCSDLSKTQCRLIDNTEITR